MTLPVTLNGIERQVAFGDRIESEDQLISIKLVRDNRGWPRFTAFIRPSSTLGWVKVGSRLTSADQAMRLANARWEQEFQGLDGGQAEDHHADLSQDFF